MTYTYPKEMTEEQILNEVNWILNPEDAVKYGPSSMICHYDFWALFIKKLVKERQELQNTIDKLEYRFDMFEV